MLPVAEVAVDQCVRLFVDIRPLHAVDRLVEGSSLIESPPHLFALPSRGRQFVVNAPHQRLEVGLNRLIVEADRAQAFGGMIQQVGDRRGAVSCFGAVGKDPLDVGTDPVADGPIEIVPSSLPREIADRVFGAGE